MAVNIINKIISLFKPNKTNKTNECSNSPKYRQCINNPHVFNINGVFYYIERDLPYEPTIPVEIINLAKNLIKYDYIPWEVSGDFGQGSDDVVSVNYMRSLLNQHTNTGIKNTHYSHCLNHAEFIKGQTSLYLLIKP